MLLRLLAGLDGRPEFVALHLDHLLRPDSEDQSRFARDTASAIGIPFAFGREDVAARAERSGRPVEEAGRLARLDFFAAAAREHRLDAVAVAHTRSDQAETLLLQLARGAGGPGLSAMPEIRPDSRGFLLWRPLLALSRAELAEIADRKGWEFYPDPSNRDLRFTRNRVRQEVLPFLARELNPRIESALARAAGLLGEDEAWLREVAKNRFEELREEAGGDEERLPVAALARLPPALARRVLREALRAVRGHLRRIEFIHIEAVMEVIREPRRGASLDLPGAVVSIEDRSLLVRPASPGKRRPPV